MAVVISISPPHPSRFFIFCGGVISNKELIMKGTLGFRADDDDDDDDDEELTEVKDGHSSGGGDSFVGRCRAFTTLCTELHKLGVVNVRAGKFRAVFRSQAGER